MVKSINNKIYKDKVDDRYCIKIRDGEQTIFRALDSRGNSKTYSMAEHKRFVKEIKNPSIKEKNIFERLNK